MKNYILLISTVIMILIYSSSCNQSNNKDKNGIITDSLSITNGDALFAKNCSGCHSFQKGGIGPKLNGLTSEVSADWITQFIKDPKKIIGSGDERAQRLFNKYKITMPSFAAFSDDELKTIIAYINTYKKAGLNTGKNDGKELSNPIPDSIKLSNLVVGLKLVAQIPSSSKDGKCR